MIGRERPPPSQDALDLALRPATSLQVREVLGGALLLEVADPAEVRAFSATLAISAGPPFHCLCPGDQALRFSGPAGPPVRLTLHHGRSLRWEEAWDTDVLLAHPGAAQEWLAARGVTQPRDEFRWAEGQARHDRARWVAWRVAAPACLRGDLDELSANAAIPPGVPDPAHDRAAEELRRALPEPAEAILVLLGWFGSGEGPWSGYPSYEAVPERLLLGFPTATIVDSLEGTEPTEAQLEGAARLFASWWFERLRPGEARRLPETLRRTLLAHVSRSPHADNRDRLRRALER